MPSSGQADSLRKRTHVIFQPWCLKILHPTPSSYVAICGGGIVGLILAIGLKERLGLTADVFEACDGFANDVGAGEPKTCGQIFFYFDVSFLLICFPLRPFNEKTEWACIPMV